MNPIGLLTSVCWTRLGSRKIMRGPKVPNHKILGAKHISYIGYIRIVSFFCQPEVKISGLVPRGFYGTALQSNLDFSNLITFLCTFEYVYHIIMCISFVFCPHPWSILVNLCLGMARAGFMLVVLCGYLKLGLEMFAKWNLSQGLKIFL